MVLARGEAQQLKRDDIGAEHLLLGPLREEEGVAAPRSSVTRHHL